MDHYISSPIFISHLGFFWIVGLKQNGATLSLGTHETFGLNFKNFLQGNLRLLRRSICSLHHVVRKGKIMSGKRERERENGNVKWKEWKEKGQKKENYLHLHLNNLHGLILSKCRFQQEESCCSFFKTSEYVQFSILNLEILPKVLLSIYLALSNILPGMYHSSMINVAMYVLARFPPSCNTFYSANRNATLW